MLPASRTTQPISRLTYHLPGAASHSLPGPDDITRVQLPNGITILTRTNNSSPSVVISGYLQVGSLFEPDAKLGLADFTASALMRGTQSRSFQEIYDLLESAGASLGISGGTHTSGFTGRALVEDLSLLLQLLAEALRQPVFPGEQVERLRSQMLTGLALRAQDTGEMASLAFDQIVYAGHPYSRPEDGYPETIQDITGQDLVEFHRQYWGPRGMVIAIVGGVQPDAAVEQVERTLGDWQNPFQPDVTGLPPVTPLASETRTNVPIPGKAQADIVIGTAGPARRSPDFLAASLANNVLGQFGMMGRIGESVREKAGLAYYASSSLSGGSGPGPWQVSAGVAPEHIEQAIALIQAEVARFVKEPVSVEELGDSQANYIGRLPLSLESNGGVVSALLTLERFELGLDYYRRYPDLVRAVTREQALEAAARYLDPERLAIATAGP